MSNRIPAILLGAAGLLGAAHAAAESAWDFAANVDVEARYFFDDVLWSGQDDGAAQLAVAATAELRWRSAEGAARASVLPYLRRDTTDEERDLADLREAYWAWEGGSWEVLVGANTVFWGVTETSHLVDVINQTDGVADVDGEDKLGQPMVNLVLQRDWGLVSLYVMPYFRERTFAGADGRLRTPLPVDTDAARFESSAKNHHVDVALRYSHYIGDIDIGVSLFQGTSREPLLLPDEEGATLVPYYGQISQFGIDLQYTRDAWLWKFEGIVREGLADTYAAGVGGLEYTFYQVGGSAADVGALIEYQYDGRGAGEPASVADNDLFAAARLAFNDTQDTAVLAGIGYDLETHARFLNVEASRRLGEDYVIELQLRAFADRNTADPIFVLQNDDYLQLQLSRYF